MKILNQVLSIALYWVALCTLINGAAGNQRDLHFGGIFAFLCIWCRLSVLGMEIEELKKSKP